MKNVFLIVTTQDGFIHSSCLHLLSAGDLEVIANLKESMTEITAIIEALEKRINRNFYRLLINNIYTVKERGMSGNFNVFRETMVSNVSLYLQLTRVCLNLLYTCCQLFQFIINFCSRLDLRI